jgi:transmembrane sensor
MKRDEPAGGRTPPINSSRGSNLHPVDWVVESNAVGDVLREMETGLRKRRRSLAIVAGTLVVFAAWSWHHLSAPALVVAPALSSSVVVSRPEQRVLSDGSIVELRDGAEITVAFTDSVRRVVLTRGEAHFQVAKMTRPFVVEVGQVEVRAVGTAFLVQRGQTAVDVLVTEGRVAVEHGRENSDGRPEAASASTPLVPSLASSVVVDVDHRVMVPVAASIVSPPSLDVQPIASTELAARLAWRSPRLEFSRTPLAEALSMIEQHAAKGNTMKVILAEPSLGRVAVSGMLRADNVGTLLRLLEEEYHFTLEYRGPREVVLHRGPENRP